MNIKQYIELLESFDTCEEAIVWSKAHATPQEAWDQCERGDWMLWLIARCIPSEPYSEQRKPLVAIAIKCARLVWRWMPQPARECIKLHERWISGENISIDRLQMAKTATADSYASAAYAAYAISATYAASAAAYASAAYAAAYATSAAYTAYVAVGAATAVDATRQKILKQIADIVRSSYPDIEEILNKIPQNN